VNANSNQAKQLNINEISDGSKEVQVKSHLLKSQIIFNQVVFI